MSEGTRRRNLILAPPRLRTVDDEGAEERHASNLELFFDLVLVVAIAALSSSLEHDHSASGWLHYVLLFVPVWWAWVGYALYADRFEVDDFVYRIAIFAAMLAIAAVAITTPHPFDPERSASFALAYFAVRAILVGLYVRVWKHEPRARPLTSRYTIAFGAGALCWLVSALVPTPGRYVLWALAMTVELGVPLVSGAAIRKVPFHASHVPERLALFTIIVLGEAVVLAVTGVGGELGGAQALVAALGFLVAAEIWWSYFAFFDDSPIHATRAGWQTFLYGHLAIFAAITATGVGVLLATEAVDSGEFDVGARWALLAGPAAFLLATAVIHRVIAGTAEGVRHGRVAAPALLVAVGFLGGGLSGGACVAVVVGVLGIHLALVLMSPPLEPAS